MWAYGRFPYKNKTVTEVKVTQRKEQCSDNIFFAKLKTRVTWKVWRYQRGVQNPYIEEEQTTQWPKEKKVQKEKQWSTKHTHAPEG